MEKEEILEKAKKKKVIIGEMEKQKINSGNWIAIISTGIVAVIWMIVEGALGHRTAIYAIASICFCWASVFYLMQFIKAKRPWQVLIGAVLDGLAFITMVILYILSVCGVI